MIDLILVDPPVASVARLGKLAPAGSYWPSLGLGFLAAVARNEGFSVKIIDSNALGLYGKLLIKTIIKDNPRFVGISATTLTIDTVGKIANAIKKKSPKTIIIVGGAHITAVPKDTLKVYKSIDIGVIGEGEVVLKKLLLALDKKRSIRKIEGLAIRNGEEIILTGNRQFIKDLDSLPFPAWDLFPNFPKGYSPAANCIRKLPAAHLFTSRGCTGTCIFCDRSVFGRVTRMHSAKRVLDMVEYLVKNYGISEIQFYDDNMALFPKRLEAICKGLIKRKLNISWTCQARCDMITPQKLKLMKAAGCWQIGLGIESGSDKILRILQKGENREIMRKAVREISKAGIEAKGYFILGNPTETKATLRETINLILSLPFTYVHTTYFTPYPGSAAFWIAERYGKFKYKNDWAKIGHGTIDSIYVPFGLTKKDLEDSAKEIFRRFYFRPKTIFYLMRKVITTPVLWPTYARGFVSVVNFAQNEKRRKTAH